MRLFLVTIVLRRQSSKASTHFAEQKAVLASDPEEAKALVLADESADDVHAIKVEDQGEDRVIRVATLRVPNREMKDNLTSDPLDRWVVVNANPVMPTQEPFKLNLNTKRS